MRWSAVLLPTAWLLQPALAVFADDAYQTDHHIPLFGLPLPDTTFFHQPYANSKASLLYTLSDKHVVGAVNPKDGAVVWRHQLSTLRNSSKGFLRAGSEQDLVVSAVDGAVTAWSASDGRLTWSKRLSSGNVEDLEILEMQGAESANGHKDALLLYNDGHAVLQRLDGDTGSVKWEYIDKSGDSAFQVSASATELYLILVKQNMLGGSKINVVSIDPVTGTKQSQYSLASDSDVSSREHILHVGANSAFPIVAWVDKSHKNVKVNILGTKNIIMLAIENTTGEDITSVALHAPHRPNALAHFLVHVQTASSHWADVYHVNLKSSSISKAYSLPKLAGRGAFSCSSVDANVFFIRITPAEMILVSSASHGILGRYALTQPLASGSVAQAFPISAAAEVAVGAGGSYPTRAAVLLSHGEWVMLRNGESLWSRPEYLSRALAATFAGLSVEQELVSELVVESHQNAISAYFHRLKRHLTNLPYLPEALSDVFSTLLGHKSSTTKALSDKFGFNKLIVVALEGRRLVALDAVVPDKTIWDVHVTSPDASETWDGVELDSSTPGAVEVNESGRSRPYIVDVLTGKVIAEVDPNANGQLSDDSKAEGFSFEVTDHAVRGYAKADPKTSIWRHQVPAKDKIISVAVRPAWDPVASIGRALGDRSVLYKHLNPNLALIASGNDAASTLTIVLLDTVSGRTLYSATHEGVDTSRPVASAISENWFAYSFTLDASSTSPSRGQQITINEMYESPLPNDRGPLGATGNYSSVGGINGESPLPHVVALTFHVPEEIEQMTVTQTRQGITSRELIVNLADSRGIVGIPRHLLDARRPVNRDPSKDEQAEGLMRYTPTLEFDPKWYLTHEREVLGIKGIITSPSMLESTSLVFAYGLDVFSTRVSPSFTFDILGKGFNKVQMLLTVAALGAAVLFIAPFVRRKQINQRWQIS